MHLWEQIMKYVDENLYKMHMVPGSQTKEKGMVVSRTTMVKIMVVLLQSW